MNADAKSIEAARESVLPTMTTPCVPSSPAEPRSHV